MIRITAYQQQIKAEHHKKVKPREFQIRDLVLKYGIRSTEEKDVGNLGPNWEGTYIAVVKGCKDSYTLATQDGEILGKH